MDPVQPQLVEGQPEDVANGGGGQAATVVLGAHPVAQAARLERATDDLVERDAADHATGVVEDDVRNLHSLLVLFRARLR